MTKECAVKLINALLAGFNMVGVMYLKSAAGEIWGIRGECGIDLLILAGALFLVYVGFRGKESV